MIHLVCLYVCLSVCTRIGVRIELAHPLPPFWSVIFYITLQKYSIFYNPFTHSPAG